MRRIFFYVLEDEREGEGTRRVPRLFSSNELSRLDFLRSLLIFPIAWFRRLLNSSSFEERVKRVSGEHFEPTSEGRERGRTCRCWRRARASSRVSKRPCLPTQCPALLSMHIFGLRRLSKSSFVEERVKKELQTHNFERARSTPSSHAKKFEASNAVISSMLLSRGVRLVQQRSGEKEALGRRS